MAFFVYQEINLTKKTKHFSRLTDTLLLPGVVPYPELGRLATLHRRPSTFLLITLAKANWPGLTLGLSSGLSTDELGLPDLGKVGLVVRIMDFR